MAKKFFPEDWEKISHDEMIRARSRLAGFTESIPDKDKAIKDVSMMLKLDFLERPNLDYQCGRVPQLEGCLEKRLLFKLPELGRAY